MKSFEEFNKENPNVKTLFDILLESLIEQGVSYAPVRKIWEDLRVNNDLRVKSEQYKLNNNYLKHYSRMYQEEHPEHKHLFKNRLTAEEKAQNESPGYNKI